jgi:hypothetical protein
METGRELWLLEWSGMDKIQEILFELGNLNIDVTKYGGYRKAISGSQSLKRI